jgi:3-oxocholest-4-en-26-oate---CoA ligase
LDSNALNGWNYGDILDGLAEVVPPDRAALIHGERVLTWGELDRRSNNLARALERRGVVPGDKCAFYLRNGPAYLETLAACFRARLTHVNVNYRYVEDELWYILDNSDSRIVVYDAEFADQVAALHPRLPGVQAWVEVGSDTPRTAFAVAYDNLADSGEGAPLGIERSGDDLLFLYTGGTTGMPKGVMWGHDDLWAATGAGATLLTGNIPPANVSEHCANVAKSPPGMIIPCCPLMHGTGLFTSLGAFAQGGTVVTLTGANFDPVELLQTIGRRGVNAISLVGDAFARPILRELDAHPHRYELGALRAIISSGVMWSPEVKQGLLRHAPHLLLVDSFGASEGVGFGRSETRAGGASEVARFMIGPDCKVFSEDFREISPGSDEAGLVARRGAIPRGYYKDAEKTAKTFPVIDGVRWSMPGDWCKVGADGTLVLLGRGSACINTAGEKVYPEEVEEVLKTYPGIVDALVVGVPDEKWGQMVTAVVQPERGVALDEAAVLAHVRARLAGYKTPKRVLTKDDLGRANNGKADYRAIGTFARAQLDSTG